MLCHGTLSALTRCPEWELTREESEKLALGVANVMKHYPHLKVKKKSLAWYNLAASAGVIYGSRLMQIATRKKRERKAAASPQDAASAGNPA